ncbi:MAG TPA: YfhO family protein, partial [Thermoanaerobaculia bacterium]|nr:YfhO family protein [Thermoanaerobaculia bacterium]
AGGLRARRSRWHWLRPVGIAIAAGIVALLLTAIFLLPVMTSINAGAEKALRKERAASRDTSEWVASPEHLRRAIRATFIPYYGGATWRSRTGEWDLGTARAGSIVIALGLVASVLMFRRRDVRFLVVLGAIALLASWKTPFIAKALHALPLYDIALNWRLGFVAALCFSLLAGMAFDGFTTSRHARWIVLATGIALAVATALLWRPQLALGVDKKLMIAGALAEFCGIALLIVALSMRSPRIAFAIVIFALAAQRVVEDGNIYPAIPRKLFYPSVPIIDAVPRDPLYRAIGSNDILIPNISAMYGLDDIRGYDSLRLGRYEDTLPMWWQNGLRGFRDVNNLALPFLSFLGVRHAITPSSMSPPPGWRVLFEDRGSRLMENSRALPRVFVPRRIRYTSDRTATLAEMAQSTDFADVAWVYAKTGQPYTADNAAANVAARRVGSRYEIDVDTPADARIVITESAWPGWRAYIDGRRTSIELANHAFLSVAVPPGKHRVRVQYLPNAFVQGRAISFATLLALAIVYRFRRFGPPATRAG